MYCEKAPARKLDQCKEIVMRRFMAFLLVASMLIVSSSIITTAYAAAEDKPMTFKVSYAESLNDPKHAAMEAFKQYVEEQSNGSLTIELYPSNELGSNADVGELISKGANIILSNAADGLADYGEPNLTAVGIFYTFQSPEEVALFAESETYAEMKANLAEEGITILSMNWVTTPRQIMSTKPLKSYSDLEKLLIRVPASTYATFFSAVGASPVSMTFGEVYTSLSSGLIEAVEAPLATLYTYSLHEVAKYIQISNHALAPALLCLSTDLFNSLSSEQQKILLNASKTAGDLYTKTVAETTSDFRKLLEENGVQFIEWSEEDLKKMAAAAKEVYAAYPEMDPDIYDRIMDSIGKGD